MSRMAELPDERYLFRYYTHDPWWINSPWLDRYGREPHDIYLPLAVSRINAKGEVKLPSHLNFLSIDDSFGNMPTQVPDEVTPHILKARYDAPTAPGPLVWVYPFDEYYDWAFRYKDRLPEIYYGDWLIRQAVNNGLPVNTVISTGSFQKVIGQNPARFKESVLLSVVPEAGSPLEKALIEFVENGGKLMVYGPADHAGKAFLDLLNLQNTAPLEGEFKISSVYTGDEMQAPLSRQDHSQRIVFRRRRGYPGSKSQGCFYQNPLANEPGKPKTRRGVGQGAKGMEWREGSVYPRHQFQQVHGRQTAHTRRSFAAIHRPAAASLRLAGVRDRPRHCERRPRREKPGTDPFRGATMHSFFPATIPTRPSATNSAFHRELRY